MTKLSPIEESLLPRYSELRAEAIIRIVLRDVGGATKACLVSAVATYRGARHLELVDLGLCSPTRSDVDWILNAMLINGSIVETDGDFVGVSL